jgi:hypothetical protein
MKTLMVLINAGMIVILGWLTNLVEKDQPINSANPSSHVTLKRIAHH